MAENGITQRWADIGDHAFRDVAEIFYFDAGQHEDVDFAFAAADDIA